MASSFLRLVFGIAASRLRGAGLQGRQLGANDGLQRPTRRERPLEQRFRLGDLPAHEVSLGHDAKLVAGQGRVAGCGD